LIKNNILYSPFLEGYTVFNILRLAFHLKTKKKEKMKQDFIKN
jgi:hypothetical protein